jgi:hypothetical protein
VLGVLNEHVASSAADGDASSARAPAAAAAAPHQPWSLWLTVLHQLEVLVEVSAERALGANGKWSVLAGLEGLKALLRLTVVQRCGGRLLVGDGAPSVAPPWPAHALSNAAAAALCSREREERTLRALLAFRRGRALTACCTASAALTPALQRALSSPPTAQLRARALALSPAHQQRALLLAGESLRILRPVVYCLAVRRCGRGSWKPWLASLVMDLSRYGRSMLRAGARLRGCCCCACQALLHPALTRPAARRPAATRCCSVCRSTWRSARRCSDAARCSRTTCCSAPRMRPRSSRRCMRCVAPPRPCQWWALCLTS